MKEKLNRVFQKSIWAVVPAVALAVLSTSAHADNLVVNGSFEQTLIPGSSEFGSQFPSQQVIGWSTGGANNVFTPGTADTTGATVNWLLFPFKLWGPNDGSSNGLTATSPDGGNFVALDGDRDATGFLQRALTQTLTGLIPGETVTIAFDWAGAQWNNKSGPSTDQLQVSLGDQTQFTSIIDNANHGFTGWQLESFDFTATSSSEVLSFMADTTPAGGPAFVLLDGVSATPVAATPEPGTLALLGTGFVGIANLVQRRRKTSASNN